MSLGQRVNALREGQGWNRKELAERAGLHPSHIGSIENGTRSGIRPDTIEKLARALNVSVQYLVQGADAVQSDLSEYRVAIEKARNMDVTPSQLVELLSLIERIGKSSGG